MTPERAQLREATRVDHERIDALFSKLDLASRKGLGTFLTAHASALVHVRPIWRQSDILNLDAMAGLIQSDLSTLGHAPPQGRPANGLRPFSDHPLGVAYVLAGAHLGRKLLRGRWQLSRDATVLRAGRFLTTTDFDGAWPAAQAALARSAPGDMDAIIRAARWTFRLFETIAVYGDRHDGAELKGPA